MIKQHRECATRLIQTCPTLMQTIISEVESRGNSRLSFQQFRALMFIDHQSKPNLSMIREHLGATLSATSKLIDGLIQDGYVSSETDAKDRRNKLLSLTASGKKEIQSHHQNLIAFLEAKLNGLTESERAMVTLAMDVLQSVLNPTP